MNWLHALVVLPLAAMVSAHRADATQQTAALSACEITEPSTSVPAVDQEGFPFPRGRWYINAERTMWAGIFALAGRALEADGPGHSILWIRPAGADLSVTGQRLDGASPPMRAVLGLVVRDRYVASKVHFPVPGCWEITAIAGGSRLSFVARVEPLPPQPVPIAR
jgi:hypothetical protein